MAKLRKNTGPVSQKTFRVKAKKAGKKKSTKTRKIKPKLPAVFGYLIVEKDEHSTYAYYESPGHHAVVEPERSQKSTRVNKTAISENCDLGDYGPAVYFVQELYHYESAIG